ncbi:MAG TPA: phosphotransferase family protein [Streptosporangiaceae bacterium]
MTATSAFRDPQAPIVTGAEPETVGPHLAEVLHDPRWRDCRVALISGGKSNLTYRVACEAGEVVLRRPPLGHVLPTAHDMAREYRVQSALHGTGVPVPRTLYLAGADSMLGVPFYLMERVVGHVCRNQLPPGYGATTDGRAAIGQALIETLARLHSTDPAAAGLADFGRGAHFMERQLRRWSQQWDSSKTADLPALDALRGQLAAALPEQRRVTIVHGDYRLDNTILHPARPGEIVAVLDWEMSTLGDPFADLGALLAYWSEPGDDDVLAAARIIPPVTAAAGFPSRGEIIARYAEITGFDPTGVRWYHAFAYYKLAVVCQGIAARAAGGAMLGAGFEDAQAIVAPLVRAGHHVLAGRR